MRAVFAVGVGVVCCGLTAGQPAKGENAKVDAARAQVATLDKAVQAFHLKNNSFPPALTALVEDRFVEAKALADPWGNQFQYDVSGKHNDGKRPDIFCVTPDKKVIGNWPEKK